MNKNLNPRQIKTIQNFWNWFQDNEQAIYHALKLNINKPEILFHFERNLSYVSKRIEFIAYEVPNQENKLHITFSALGYKKLFPKVIALGETAPRCEQFEIQTFIKPCTAENQHLLPIVIAHLAKESLLKLEDYNLVTKKVIITLYMPEGYEKSDLDFLVYFILGEVNYKKHIKKIIYKPMPQKISGLLPLTELPEFIEYLVKINYSRKLKIFFEK